MVKEEYRIIHYWKLVKKKHQNVDGHRRLKAEMECQEKKEYSANKEKDQKEK
jgi:hypothetical protein